MGVLRTLVPGSRLLGRGQGEHLHIVSRSTTIFEMLVLKVWSNGTGRPQTWIWQGL